MNSEVDRQVFEYVLERPSVPGLYFYRAHPGLNLYWAQISISSVSKSVKAGFKNQLLGFNQWRLQSINCLGIFINRNPQDVDKLNAPARDCRYSVEKRLIGKSVTQALNLAFFAAVKFVVLRITFDVRALQPR